MNLTGYFSFFVAVMFTMFMNLLGYFSFFVAVMFTMFFIICMVIQQVGTYHKILEKARKFANNNHSRELNKY
jgi:high-affinity Fe2+/Pb2+ permease